MRAKCESEIEEAQKALTSSEDDDTIETRKIVDAKKVEERLSQLTNFMDEKYRRK